MKTFTRLLFSFTAISTSWAGDLKKFNFEQNKQIQQSTAQNLICGFDDLKLPTEFSVFAAGAYSGRTLTYQIDQSGHEGTQIDVVVNSTNKPVVLMLGA